mmetsp:Transcript_37443/g.94075  ORF Transcript_37443/g.94075 Transcript_37443/m.94075 type:complete len:944 (-) Transcript_37443:2115-4946(-)
MCVRDEQLGMKSVSIVTCHSFAQLNQQVEAIVGSNQRDFGGEVFKPWSFWKITIHIAEEVTQRSLPAWLGQVLKKVTHGRNQLAETQEGRDSEQVRAQLVAERHTIHRIHVVERSGAQLLLQEEAERLHVLELDDATGGAQVAGHLVAERLRKLGERRVRVDANAAAERAQVVHAHLEQVVELEDAALGAQLVADAVQLVLAERLLRNAAAQSGQAAVAQAQAHVVAVQVVGHLHHHGALAVEQLVGDGHLEVGQRDGGRCGILVAPRKDRQQSKQVVALVAQHQLIDEVGTRAEVDHRQWAVSLLHRRRRSGGCRLLACCGGGGRSSARLADWHHRIGGCVGAEQRREGQLLDALQVCEQLHGAEAGGVVGAVAHAGQREDHRCVGGHAHRLVVGAGREVDAAVAQERVALALVEVRHQREGGVEALAEALEQEAGLLAALLGEAFDGLRVGDAGRLLLGQRAARQQIHQESVPLQDDADVLDQREVLLHLHEGGQQRVALLCVAQLQVAAQVFGTDRILGAPQAVARALGCRQRVQIGAEQTLHATAQRVVEEELTALLHQTIQAVHDQRRVHAREAGHKVASRAEQLTRGAEPADQQLNDHAQLLVGQAERAAQRRPAEGHVAVAHHGAVIQQELRLRIVLVVRIVVIQEADQLTEVIVVVLLLQLIVAHLLLLVVLVLQERVCAQLRGLRGRLLGHLHHVCRVRSGGERSCLSRSSTRLGLLLLALGQLQRLLCGTLPGALLGTAALLGARRHEALLLLGIMSLLLCDEGRASRSQTGAIGGLLLVLGTAFRGYVPLGQRDGGQLLLDAADAILAGAHRGAQLCGHRLLGVLQLGDLATDTRQLILGEVELVLCGAPHRHTQAVHHVHGETSQQLVAGALCVGSATGFTQILPASSVHRSPLKSRDTFVARRRKVVPATDGNTTVGTKRHLHRVGTVAH